MLKIMSVFGYIAVLSCIAIVLGNAGYGPAMSGAFTFLCLFAVGLFIYFLPTIVANVRGHRHVMAIFCTNLFLGWTFVSWVAALVWSCMNTKKQLVQVVQPVRVVDARWQNLRA